VPRRIQPFEVIAGPPEGRGPIAPGTISRVPATTWPPAFAKAVITLVLALCAITIAGAGLSLARVLWVRSSGVTVEATALGEASGSGPTDVYVRFLVGDQAVVTTTTAPLWVPTHGTRVTVAYLTNDPAGSVRIVDSRVGGGYAAGLLGLAVGIGCAAVAVAAYRRSGAHRPARVGHDSAAATIIEEDST
jgi:hypothetical protein